jgi:hypothetical protein
MRTCTATRTAIAAISLVLVSAPLLMAADPGIGTWVRRTDPAGREFSMTIEAWGNGGRKLTYRTKLRGAERVMTIESPMDGTDVPAMVNGKPSAETMGIKRVDSHHTVTVIKVNGQQVGTSRSTLSADLNTLTVEGDGASGKTTEILVRK